jgi:hypothetical protein
MSDIILVAVAEEPRTTSEGQLALLAETRALRSSFDVSGPNVVRMYANVYRR